VVKVLLSLKGVPQWVGGKVRRGGANRPASDALLAYELAVVGSPATNRTQWSCVDSWLYLCTTPCCFCGRAPRFLLRSVLAACLLKLERRMCCHFQSPFTASRQDSGRLCLRIAQSPVPLMRPRGPKFNRIAREAECRVQEWVGPPACSSPQEVIAARRRNPCCA